jgi:hypothetical protein
MEDPGVDGRTIIKWVSKNWDEEAWTIFIWLRAGTGCGLF